MLVILVDDDFGRGLLGSLFFCLLLLCGGPDDFRLFVEALDSTGHNIIIQKINILHLLK